MSWLFSQALVEEYLEANCSDGEPFAQSSGSHLQLAYLPPDRMTDFSRISRFGMTFRPLTVDRGEELLMSYLEVFHAKTSQSQAKETDWKEKNLGSGEKWHGWLAKFDPDLCSWRIAQCSLLEDSIECLVTLPRSGMTRDGMLWERQTLAHRTNETGSGSWPTPTVHGNYNRKGVSKTSGDGLATAVMKWPTPTAHNAKETNAPSEYNRNTPTLTAQAGGPLNPMWVEWLMGWPLGLTDLKPLAMDKFQFVRQWRLNFCQKIL